MTDNSYCNCGLGGEECDGCKIGELMDEVRDLRRTIRGLQKVIDEMGAKQEKKQEKKQ